MNQATKKTSPLPDNDQLVSCKTCIQSVPLSEAVVVEAQEYITYFCGLECFDEWIHQKPKENK